MKSSPALIGWYLRPEAHTLPLRLSDWKQAWEAMRENKCSIYAGSVS